MRIPIQSIVPALLMLTAMPAMALPSTFKGSLRIIAPVPGQPAAQRLPGTISAASGKWRLFFETFNGSQASPSIATTSIEVDLAAQTATVLERPGESAEKQSFTDLRQLGFSAFAREPKLMAGLLLAGDSLSQRAKFIRNGIYQGKAIQVFSFSESKDIFGQIFYSSSDGMPLKIDTYDATNNVRTFIEIEAIKP